MLDGPSDKKGIGFALSIERLLLALESEGIELPIKQNIDVYVLSLGDKANDFAMQLTNTLRLSGLQSQNDYFNKKMKAQLKTADRYLARYTVIVGESELENGEVIVKDMKKFTQENVKIEKIQEYILEKMEEI